MSNKLIGIDFGLNNSYVGILRNNQIEIHTNQINLNSIPSIVYFLNDETLVGRLNQNFSLNEKNTIFHIRKLIGKNIKDKEIQDIIKKLPYKLDENSDEIKIIIENEKEIKKIKVNDILKIIYDKLIEVSNNCLGYEKVNKAILTIPPYFNNIQRDLIKNIFKLTNVELLNLIDEPISACYYFNLYSENKNKNIFVFSMNHNELDISIVSLINNEFKILITNHKDIGGEDFTNKIIEYCKEEYKKKEKKF